MKIIPKNIIVAIVVFLGILSTAVAEIPLVTQQSFQKSAPEKIEIEVQKVKKKWRFLGNRKLEVEAKIIKVESSKTGLKPGQTIMIQYIHVNPKSRTSGSYVSAVEKGKKYKAYIGSPSLEEEQLDSKNRKIYIPKAASATFVDLSDKGRTNHK